ncbi:hypothetical protein C2E23DRAFT_706500, partial [Lenzites betulinus]
IVKIVNALSGAAELGGPAVSAYLLGNPDHYTSGVFKIVHWRSYVRKVIEDVGAARPDPTESVVLGLSEGDVVPLAKINDYIFRPQRFSTWTLYDFLRLTDVQKLRKKDTFRSAENIQSDPDMSDNDVPDDEPDSHVSMKAQFLSGHPLRSTHGVCIRHHADTYVLNFVGGTPPRPDRGDKEEYCSTMLALFHPGGWRHGRDLRQEHESWAAAFEHVKFASADVQVMKNMNLLYECLDARDDFS